MANRSFSQFFLSLLKQPVLLTGRVTFGSSGAPTLDAVSSKGIKSITRNSAGKYTVVLQDTYPKLFAFKHVFVVGSGAPAAPAAFLISEQVASGTTPSFVVQFNAAGTATDPASGEEVRFTLILTNSNAP